MTDEKSDIHVEVARICRNLRLLVDILDRAKLRDVVLALICGERWNPKPEFRPAPCQVMRNRRRVICLGAE